MRRWSQQFRRLMLISPASVVTFAVAVLGAELTRFVPLLYGANPGSGEMRPFREMRTACVAMIVMVAAVLYGFRRAGAFHPLYRTRYFAWLKLTPWTWRQPLPLGPVRLVWTDLVILGALMGVEWWRGGMNPIAPLVGFGGAYALASFPILVRTERSNEVLWLAVLPPLLGFLYPHPQFVAALIILLFAVAYWGVVRSLRTFPWERERPWRPSAIGWPHAQLGPPITREIGTSRAGAVMVSAIIGWWLLGLCWPIAAIKGMGQADAAVWTFLFGFLAALFRYGIYCGSNRPPLALRGRIATGRLIIPRYDYVLIAPALTFATAIALPQLLRTLAVPPPLSLALSIGTVLALALAMPPSRRHWELTGAFHMLPPRVSTNDVKRVG
jgi:hypothetical protein